MKKISAIISDSNRLGEFEKVSIKNKEIKEMLIELNSLFKLSSVHFSDNKLSIFMPNQSDAYFVLYSKAQIQTRLADIGVNAQTIDVKVKP